MVKNNKFEIIDKHWKEIKSGIQNILHLRPVGKEQFMELYSAIYNICSYSERETQSSTRKRKKIGDRYNLVENYERIRYLVNKILEQVKKSLSTSLYFEFQENDPEEVNLKLYCESWNNFEFSSKVLNGIASYLNRHWLSYGSKKIYNEDVNFPNRILVEDKRLIAPTSIYEQCILVWKEIIFNKMSKELTCMLIQLIDKDRKNAHSLNQSLINGLIKRIIGSFIKMGNSNEPLSSSSSQESGSDDNNAVKTKTIYEALFEKAFIESTREFYKNESSSYIQTNTFSEYLLMAKKRIQEEEKRVEFYLSSSTYSKLIGVCEKILISDPIQYYIDGFKNLLSDRNSKGNVENLELIYSLLTRQKSSLEILKREYNSFILNEGLSNLDLLFASFSNESIDFTIRYVTTILEIRSFHYNLIEKHFSNNGDLKEAADIAISNFINENSISKLTKCSHKSAELLAKYSDFTLRRCNKSHKDIEDSMNEIITICDYIKDKDAFQVVYQKFLANRLINITNLEIEHMMIGKFKNILGYEYTLKLQRMYQDINTSKDLSKDFILTEGGQKFNKRNQTYVLSQAFWPFAQTCSEISLPPNFEKYIEGFQKFYLERFNGRKIIWLLNRCKGELQLSGFDKSYTFQAKLSQIAILLLFNSKLEYSFSEIVALTKIKKEEAMMVSKGLIKINLLKIKETTPEVEAIDDDENNSILDETIISLNNKYKNKKINQNICALLANRTESKKETDSVESAIAKDRVYAIQAAVVRIMKSRKSLRHQELVAETIKILQDRFKLEISAIKKVITQLIDKDYIKRGAKSNEIYEYIA